MRGHLARVLPNVLPDLLVRPEIAEAAPRLRAQPQPKGGEAEGQAGVLAAAVEEGHGRVSRRQPPEPDLAVERRQRAGDHPARRWARVLMDGEDFLVQEHLLLQRAQHPHVGLRPQR